MPCKKCLVKPVHSFSKIGTLGDGASALYYTKPSIAQEDDSPDNMTDFFEHFEDTRPNPWFWIFDCKDMKSKDFISNGSGIKMAGVLQTSHYETLKGVFIINPTMTMRVFLGIIRPFLKKETNSKIHMCSLGLINTVDKLQKIGTSQKDIQFIMKLITQG